MAASKQSQASVKVEGRLTTTCENDMDTNAAIGLQLRRSEPGSRSDMRKLRNACAGACLRPPCALACLAL